MYEYDYTDELYHYGVKGMKWGVRRAQKLETSDTRKRYDSAKSDYRDAKKAYNKSYNKAHNYSSLHPIGQFVSKKQRAESDRRWEDAVGKADNLIKTKKAYKEAKADRKDAIDKTHNEFNKKASFGEKFMYNDATRKKAAKYVVDNNMSMSEASKRAKSDANRNTALVIGAMAAVTVGQLYAQSRK